VADDSIFSVDIRVVCVGLYLAL